MNLLERLPFPLEHRSALGQVSLGKATTADAVAALDRDLARDLDLVAGLRPVLAALRVDVVAGRADQAMVSLFVRLVDECVRDWVMPRRMMRRTMAVVTDGLWPTHACGWNPAPTVGAYLGTLAVSLPPAGERQPPELIGTYATADAAIDAYLHYCTDRDGDQILGRGMLARVQDAAGLPVTTPTDVKAVRPDEAAALLSSLALSENDVVRELQPGDSGVVTRTSVDGQTVIGGKRSFLRELGSSRWEHESVVFSWPDLALDSFRPSPVRGDPHRPQRPDVLFEDAEVQQIVGQTIFADQQLRAWLIDGGLPPEWAIRHHPQRLDQVDQGQPVVMSSTPVLGLHVRFDTAAPFTKPIAVTNSQSEQRRLFRAAVARVT